MQPLHAKYNFLKFKTMAKYFKDDKIFEVTKMVNFAKALVRQNGKKMAILGLKNKNMRKTTLEVH